MEKTRIALEKARKQREAAHRHGPVQRGGAAAPPVIAYRETRVFALDPVVIRRELLVAADPRDARADIYRLLRSQVQQRLAALQKSELAVCSANYGEGKTLVAANLALTLAMDPNSTVLLVDLDLRRPRLHETFGFRPRAGLDDYLLGDAALPDCLANPGVPGLVLLPVRRPLPESSEVLSTPKMLDLTRELRSRYADRIVIYDVPPVLATDDCLVALRGIGSCLLVVEEGRARREEVRRSHELLGHVQMIGTVLNKSRSAKLQECA